ncbi:MerR family transcriptional regulator [Streptomyces sp. NPDC127039]|uniref:MerR family transcriptional regulator n=1 Tax=Streptomyces sp. NPDC127039 TaxID=3347115 RepID=UPI003652CDB9
MTVMQTTAGTLVPNATSNATATDASATDASATDASATDASGTDVCSAPTPRHPRPDGQDRYTISEVVAFTGLTAHTLRWYERIGLMSHIDRSHTGQRRYSNRDLDWLDFVGKLRMTGMPVADMVRYAEMVREGESTYLDRRELLESTRRDVLTRIAELQDTVAVLDRKISFYGDAGRAREGERDR